MFWEFDFNSTSQIDKILDEETCTLEQILDQDDVLQECKASNDKLLKYLTVEAQLDRLIRYVVDMPDDPDEMNRFKYSSIASEVLTCDAWSMTSAVSEAPVLNRFYAYFEQDEVLHPLHASFVVRVLSGLFQKSNESMAAHLKENPQHLRSIIKHIRTPAVVELLVCISGSEMNLQDWLTSNEHHFVEDILSKLAPAEQQDAEELSNVHRYISEVVINCRREASDQWQRAGDSPPSPLLAFLLRQDTVEQILKDCFEGTSLSLEYSLEVLLELVREPPIVDDDQEFSSIDRARHKQEVQGVLAVLAPKFSQLHDIVVTHKREEPLQTGSGVLEKPVGKLRLTAVHLVVALMEFRHHDMIEEIIKAGTVGVCLAFLGDYPENNFMHKYIFDMLSLAIPDPDNAAAGRKDEDDDSELVPTDDDPAAAEAVNDLYRHVFVDYNLFQRLLDLWAENNRVQSEGKGHRLGYMGYWLKIADRILALEGSPRDPLTLFGDSDVVAGVASSWRALVDQHIRPLLKVAKEPLGGAPPQGFADSDDSDFYVPRSAEDYMRVAGTGDVSDNAADNSAAFQDFCTAELAPKFPDFRPAAHGTEESEEDIALNYGMDGIFSPGLVYDTDLAPFVVDGISSVQEPAYDEPAPDALDTSMSVPIVNEAVASSTNDSGDASAPAAADLDSSASESESGVRTPSAVATGGGLPLSDSSEDEDEDEEDMADADVDEEAGWTVKSVPMDGLARGASNEPVDEDEGDNSEDKELDTDSDEELSASYDLQTMSMTPTKPAIDIPLSPRSTNAVRHIHTRADPQASSPVAASASDELKTFALLEQDSSTDDLSKPAAIAADDAAGTAASPATAKSNGSNSSTPGSGVKKPERKRSLPSTPVPKNAKS